MTPNPQETDHKRKRRRQATVYDAVAGRVGYESFLPSQKGTSSIEDTSAKATTAVAPEEVLFKRKNAPARYEEDDIYFQDRHLDRRQGQSLPDSDLLKAIHAYVSEFYADQVEGGDVNDFWSMEETALLALGILVEEVAGTASEEIAVEGSVAVEREPAEG